MNGNVLRPISNALANLIKATPALVFLLLVALASWRLAGGLWRLYPAPPPAAIGFEADDSPRQLIARHWYGAAVRPAPAAATAATVQAAIDAQLIGVIAGGKHPQAVVRQGGKTVELSIGDRLANGGEIVTIQADSVGVRLNGQMQQLDLFIGATRPANNEAAAASLRQLTNPGVSRP